MSGFSNNTPDKLLKGKVNRHLEKEILCALDVDIIRKNQCREIMTKTGAVQSELYRAIIRQKLKYKPYPLSIGRGNLSPIFSEVYFKKKKYDEIAGKFLTLFNNSSKEP